MSEDLKMRVPVPLLRRLLGDDVIDAARAEAWNMSLEDPEGYAAVLLHDDFLARLYELLATSERVREAEDRLIESWRQGASA